MMVILDEPTRGELLRLARHTLESYTSTGGIPEFETDNPGLLQLAGAFVSLHEGEELRGCIGQIAPDQELFRVVQSCVLSAAFDDSRFAPVSAEEVPRLSLEISVLSPLEPVEDIGEIEVGKHGLYISRGPWRGLLLPQVATEYGWSREMFLANTCRKAGLPENAWKEPSTSIQKFEAQVFGE
jgi:AmmeMemoRadiSam system protein A